MKKALLLFGILMFFCSVSSANNYENDEKMPCASCCGLRSQHEKKYQKDTEENSSPEEKSCKEDTESHRGNFEIDDDEYFTYNQCFFDRQYRKMKRQLCLTRRQENCADNIYKNYKIDIERLNNKYIAQKDEIMKAIENNCPYKENKNNIKEIQRELKGKYNDFKEEIEELLCKNQKSSFRNFQKEQKEQFKKLKKYCVVYKFPC